MPILGKEQIIIGYDIIDRGISAILQQLKSSTYVLITDTNIAKHEHVKSLTKKLREQLNDQQRLLELHISPGEMSKSRRTKAAVEDFMLKNSCTRDAVVLAVGGGVIGDMIGYVAATFMRGVKYVQIPTTLLSMVDSSIGGKTAIDVPSGKNLVGSFWQPQLNIIELRFLETLPKREFINGMAEIVKTAAIWNATEFERLEQVNPQFMAALAAPRDAYGKVDLSPIKDDLLATVCGSVRVKAEVVTLDEREGGLRNILNFGHSIGHAYEALLTPHILHGECVAIGCVLEAELSRYLGHLAPAAVARLISCLKAYELPVTINDPIVKARSRNVEIPIQKLIDIMAVDKKNAGKEKRVVLLSEIGKTYEPKASAVTDNDIGVILGEDMIVSKHHPAKGSEFTVIPPGSKSISNRVLVLCALAKGTCEISNLLHSDDTGYMLEALQKLGAAKVEISGDKLIVTGFGGANLQTPSSELYLGNAGTAARFLTAVAALVNGQCHLTGNKRMQERPIGALVDALRSNGTTVDYVKNEKSLPLVIHGKGKLTGGRIELAATVSSQYVSALLMVAPYAASPVTLKLTGGKPISQFYIDMTIQMMADFGINVVKSDSEEHTYHIPQGSYTAPGEYTVESDASSATYPLAFAAMTGTQCTVPTIGSASLQGDAKFAVDVLGRMGCVVNQTATSTTVTGPSDLNLKGIDVDMEPMTDAFLTACVVAAVAQGTTRIVGIANQHVKECDRIMAMTDQLAKFGVKCVPSDDGIEIHGIGSDSAQLRVPPSVLHAYDDHRVAMSLSLLATRAHGSSIIDERRCVEKTWPGWWDTLHTVLGVPLKGSDPHHVDAYGNPIVKHTNAPQHSIVFVGMRGAGKTSLAKVTAEVLGFTFLDLDHHLEDVEKKSIRSIIAEHGWEEFRKLEAELLVRVLKSHNAGYAIACGGGIIENENNREALKQFSGPVVHVHRNLNDIISLLNEDKSRPSFTEDLESVYRRREPLYEEVSNMLFWQPRVVSHDQLRASVLSFFSDSPEIKYDRRSFFLSLTTPNLVDIESHLVSSALEGVNAVELRVDLLEQWSTDFVAEQVALLRLGSSLPIIFTVRSESQGGKFPDENTDQYLGLINLALRLGVEYIDVELTQTHSHPTVLKNRGNRTKFIASHHDPKGSWDWNGFEWRSAFFDANRLGDIVKFVGFAHGFEDNFKLEDFRTEISASKTPFIGINMGTIGQMSRVINKVLTPVTHPLLQVKAAPGQLSVKECNSLLAQLGGIYPRKYFVTGQPIGHSQSPNIHNSGYEALGLPHTYTKFETDNVDAVKREIKDLGDHFGGASVTIPLKESIISLCSELSEDAQLIGAVNTLIPLGNGNIKGSNTDWNGIVNAFNKYGSVFTGENALVIGAGGTALAAVYAFYRMGFSKIFIINRTASKAEAIAERFRSLIEVIPVTDDVKVTNVNACLSCIPGDQSPPEKVVSKIQEVFKQNKSTLLEAAYKPAVTPIMEAATNAGWKTIPGRQMLVMQGVEQFRIWTGFTPLNTAESSIE